MLHGYRVSPESGRKYRIKTVKCLVCGKEIEFKTCPPDKCDNCRPYRRYSEYQRNYSQTRRAHRRIQTAQPVFQMVLAAPGFCSKCGCVRLSKANKNGVCDGCEEEYQL